VPVDARRSADGDPGDGRHRLAGHCLDTRNPAIHDLLRGIRRVHGIQQRRVTATTTPAVQTMSATCGASLRGRRDRSLLLLGFAAAK
jgi:hypothetical protein